MLWLKVLRWLPPPFLANFSFAWLKPQPSKGRDVYLLNGSGLQRQPHSCDLANYWSARIFTQLYDVVICFFFYHDLIGTPTCFLIFRGCNMLNHYVRTECQAGCELLAMRSEPCARRGGFCAGRVDHSTGESTHFSTKGILAY